MGEAKRRRQSEPAVAKTGETMQTAGDGLYHVTLFGFGYLAGAARKLNTPEEKDLTPGTLRTLSGLLGIMDEMRSDRGMQCACCDDIDFSRNTRVPAAALMLIEVEIENRPMATL